MLPFSGASRTCPGPYSRSCTGSGSWPEERGNIVLGVCVCVCACVCVSVSVSTSAPFRLRVSYLSRSLQPESHRIW